MSSVADIGYVRGPPAATALPGRRRLHPPPPPDGVTIHSLSAAPRYFRTPAAFRAWLRKNHATVGELLVGFIRRHAANKESPAAPRSITWPESVAEALCYGWIDGVRRTIDADRYTIRFTPRRKGSRWSAINLRMMAELEKSGRMTPAGRAALAARKGSDPGRYSYETRETALDAARQRTFRRNGDAFEFFEAQAPSYRRKALWWIMSARQEATRDDRLARVIAASAAGKRLA